MGSLGQVMVVIPALNEASTVQSVITQVKDVLPGATVVVVDDGSCDGTAAEASRAGATVLSLPFNCGVGAAIEAGYRYAALHGAQAVVQLDADGQHDPRDVPRLLALLGEADVVVGTRFGSSGYRVRGPRKWSMVLLSRTVSAVVGVRLSDVTSGFRASGPAAIGVFAQSYPAQYLGDTVEALVLASRADLQISEVEVTMRERQGGRASHGTTASALHVGRAFLALFAAVTRPAQKHGES